MVIAMAAFVYGCVRVKFVRQGTVDTGQSCEPSQSLWSVRSDKSRFYFLTPFSSRFRQTLEVFVHAGWRDLCCELWHWRICCTDPAACQLMHCIRMQKLKYSSAFARIVVGNGVLKWVSWDGGQHNIGSLHTCLIETTL
jgi:hypothetical protein